MAPRQKHVWKLATEGPEYEDAEPPKKKPRKELEKKVAVWKDIKEWKEGDHPLGRFPVEVLDLIISVDSDLELRDHLALSAVCRHFRTCYRDVVFQVLFQAEFSEVVPCVNSFDIDIDGTPLSDYYSPFKRTSGPFNRSFNSARRIFSSGRSLVGAGDWIGWGLAGSQYQANELQSLEAMKDIDRFIELEVKAADAAFSERYLREHDAVSTDATAYLMMRDQVSKTMDMRDEASWNHGMPHNQVRTPRYLQLIQESRDKNDPVYDPWPSPWREEISKIVNDPWLSHSDAKRQYKVSDRELLSIKETDLSWDDDAKPGRHYLLASVQALAYRSHGGADGHYEYCYKLHERRERAREKREKKKAEANASALHLALLAANPPSAAAP